MGRFLDMIHLHCTWVGEWHVGNRANQKADTYLVQRNMQFIKKGGEDETTLTSPLCRIR